VDLIVCVVKEIDGRIISWSINDTIRVLHDDDLSDWVVQDLHLDVYAVDLSGCVTFLEWRAMEPEQSFSITFSIETILNE
jgi:hypothetical protein